MTEGVASIFRLDTLLDIDPDYRGNVWGPKELQEGVDQIITPTIGTLKPERKLFR